MPSWLKPLCYRLLPSLHSFVLLVECILIFVRIKMFFAVESHLFNNALGIGGFILDWISSLSSTLLGIIVNLANVLIPLCRFIRWLYTRRRNSDNNSIRCCSFLDHYSEKALVRFVQLNCNCPCYIARPKLRFIVRLGYLFICLTLKIVAIGLYAATGSDTQGGTMAILCTVSVVCLIFIFFFDLFQYSVWWHYKPSCDNRHEPLSRKHVRYLPYSLIGDHRTMRLGDRPCSNNVRCENRCLEHILIFHSRDYKPQERYSDIHQNAPGRNLYIGFHRTSPESAVSIAHSDFNISTEYRRTMLGHGIYFARSMKDVEGKAHADGAYICAEIEMGRVKQVNPGPETYTLRGTTHLWNEYDTVYYNHSNPSRDEFCVKSPDQILRWVIVIDQDFDSKVHEYGLDTEFADTKCGCI